MSDIDLDSPDLTALALGEADGERLDRALEFLIRSEEARAMAAETLKLGERLSAAFGRERGAGLSESFRTQVIRAARRQVWARRLKRAGLTVAICGLTAAVTLAGAAVLPDGRAAESGGSAQADAKNTSHATASAVEEGRSAGLELGGPVATAGGAGGFYHLSLSSDAVQAAAEKNWKFALGPDGEAVIGPVVETVAQAAEPATESAESGLDAQIAKRLEKIGISSGDVDDATYFRRLHLDATGTPPAPAELDAFLKDPAPDKRAAAAGRFLAGDNDFGRWYAGRQNTAGFQFRGGGAPGGPAAYDESRGQSYGAFATDLGSLVPPEQQLGVHGGLIYIAPSSAEASKYPAEVQAIVDELDAHEAQVRKQIERWLRGEKFEILDRLRRLQDEYTRAGRLDDAIAVRSLVQKLEDELLDVQPDPSWLTGYRGRTGETLIFRITGNPAAGSVWGSDVYTDDSSLAAAAVHAGALGAGETGLVQVTMLPGQSSYTAAARNGVTSSSYGDWQGSYRVARFDWKTAAAAGADVLDASGRINGPYRRRVGESFVVQLTAQDSAGAVWGTDTYTDDSAVATAAVHAGVLKSGETGQVRITILPGQESYAGTERNGITSLSYHSWGGSFRIERAETPKPTATIDVTEIAEDPGNLMAHVTRVGGTHLFRVTGSNDGPVWGTDVYTSDSDLSTAAVHSGVLKEGEAGIVKATILEGQFSYPGTERNGVTSNSWESWNASYRLERVDPVPAGDPNAGTASAGGKYQSLLMTIDAPDDVTSYDKFHDFGWWTGTSYLGHDNLPPAYWVYLAPRWYLWSATTQPGVPGGTPANPYGPRRTGAPSVFRSTEVDNFLGGPPVGPEPAPANDAPVGPPATELAPATGAPAAPVTDLAAPAGAPATSTTTELALATGAPGGEPTSPAAAPSERGSP